MFFISRATADQNERSDARHRGYRIREIPDVAQMRHLHSRPPSGLLLAQESGCRADATGNNRKRDQIQPVSPVQVKVSLAPNESYVSPP